MTNQSVFIAGAITIGLLCSSAWAERQEGERGHEESRQETDGERRRSNGTDEEESRLQFEIQMGTQEQQNAESVRSDAVKKKEGQKEVQTRKWGK